MQDWVVIVDNHVVGHSLVEVNAVVVARDDVVENDIDEFVAIAARLLVVETNNVKQLVDDNAHFHAVGL